MVRKRLKSPERRQQILDVALKVFARKGYGGATTANIAKQAGITEPILYRHFKNKKDLFHRLLESVSEGTLERWQGMMQQDGSIKKQILAMAKNLPDQLEEDELSIALINRAVADSHDDKTLGKIMLEHYARYAGFLEELVRKGIKQKEFRKGLNVRRAAWQLMGPGLAYSVTQGLAIDKKLKGQALQTSIETLLDSWE